jgi:hypothetical protein
MHDISYKYNNYLNCNDLNTILIQIFVIENRYV